MFLCLKVGPEEKEILSRDELMCMMKITRDIGLEIQNRQDGNDDNDNVIGNESIQMDEKDVLLPEEVKAIRGVLSLTQMKVKELMVPIEVGAFVYLSSYILIHILMHILIHLLIHIQCHLDTVNSKRILATSYKNCKIKSIGLQGAQN